jgi:hypothetical protein
MAEGTVWYRSRRGIWLQSWLILVVAAAGVFLAATGAAGGRLANVVIGALALLGAAGCLILALRAGIGAGQDHVIVRARSGREQRVAWPAVAGFDLEPAPSQQTVVMIVVACHDERRLTTRGCWFYPRLGGDVRKEQAREMIRALEAERVTRTGDQPVPDPDPADLAAGDRGQAVWSRLGRRALGVFIAASIIAILGWMSFLVFEGATSLGPAIQASHGQGTQGYFLPRDRVCTRGGCTWTGDFQRLDGTVTRHGVFYEDNPNSQRVGQAVSALDTGDPEQVFPRHDTLAWRWPAIQLSSVFVVAGIVILLVRDRDGLWEFLSDPTRYDRSGRYNG